MSEIKTGNCHCGAVEFRVKIGPQFDDLRRCNCSLCRRKGAVMASVSIDNLKVTKGMMNLSVYQWNSKTAKHFFCKTCGIYTHHQRRSNPLQFGFNVGCIENINPLDFETVAIGDGASQSLV